MKDIKGYEGLYAITEDGEVWSYPKKRSSRKGKWLKPFIQSKKRVNGTTYSLASVGLRKDKKRSLFLVHRLVAQAYIPNPKNKKQVNHKNGNSLKNYVDNLEWATGFENMQHAQKMGLLIQCTEKQKATRSHNGKKTGAINGMKSRRMFTMEEADCIRKIYKVTKKSYRSIARAYNCTANTIIKICNCKSYVQEAQHDRIKNISSYPTVKTRG